MRPLPFRSRAMLRSLNGILAIVSLFCSVSNAEECAMNGTSSSGAKAGLAALLTPANCALILIDHQPFQFAGLRSHDTQTIINNVVGLAKPRRRSVCQRS